MLIYFPWISHPNQNLKKKSKDFDVWFYGCYWSLGMGQVKNIPALSSYIQAL